MHVNKFIFTFYHLIWWTSALKSLWSLIEILQKHLQKWGIYHCYSVHQIPPMFWRLTRGTPCYLTWLPHFCKCFGRISIKLQLTSKSRLIYQSCDNSCKILWLQSVENKPSQSHTCRGEASTMWLPGKLSLTTTERSFYHNGQIYTKEVKGWVSR